jgi:putative oxidoreductase
MGAIKQYGPLVGRILLALIFVLSGLSKLGGFAGTVGYIQSVGLPAAQLLAVIAIMFELGGGLLLVLGWKARWGAAALFVFTFLAAVLFHAYWAAAPDQAMMQQIQFMKNLAMMGGLLYIVVYGSGPLSLEKRA